MKNKNIIENIKPNKKVHIKRDNGTTVYCEEYGNPKGNPFIIFHGALTGSNKKVLNFFLNDENKTLNHRVIIFDQRGYGKAKNPKNLVFISKELISDIPLIYKEFNLKKASLIGVSWGGAQALYYANKNPSKVENLILLAPFLMTKKNLYNLFAKQEHNIKPWMKKNGFKNPVKAFGELFNQIVNNNDTKAAIVFMHSFIELNFGKLKLFLVKLLGKLSFIPKLGNLDMDKNKKLFLKVKIFCNYLYSEYYLNVKNNIMIDGMDFKNLKKINSYIVAADKDPISPLKDLKALSKKTSSKFVVLNKHRHQHTKKLEDAVRKIISNYNL